MKSNRRFRKKVIRAVHARDRRIIQKSDYLNFNTSSISGGIKLGKVLVINFLSPTFNTAPSVTIGSSNGFPLPVKEGTAGALPEQMFSGNGYFLKGFTLKGGVTAEAHNHSVTLLLCQAKIIVSESLHNRVMDDSYFWEELPNGVKGKWPVNGRMKANFKVIKRIPIANVTNVNEHAKTVPFRVYIPLNRTVKDADTTETRLTVPYTMPMEIAKMMRWFWLVVGCNHQTYTSAPNVEITCDIVTHFSNLP